MSSTLSSTNQERTRQSIMCKADMACRNCGNEWEYSGLANDSCFCPICGQKNRIPSDATKVYSHQGFGYEDDILGAGQL